MKIGARLNEDKSIDFTVWAPKAKSVELLIAEKRFPMEPQAFGYYTITLPACRGPIDYQYVLDKKLKRPDPASSWQPKGVHGPSRVLDTSTFRWEDSAWQGIPLEKYIIYELHVGTFTLEGTFEAAIEKLPHLQSLGITAIELMPVIEFAGDRNWGYDGTYPFAPHHAYGGPEKLQKLINECHKAGLAVILDVVYNHLGPEGNYLGDFGYYFTDRYKTPWGAAINFDGPDSDPVRNYFIQNALYWKDAFHVDALRLDAVHAIFDLSAYHILEELQEAFSGYIFAESDLNDVRIINPVQHGGYGISAQWNDDFHHAVHTLLTGSRWGYFVDFGKMEDLAKAMKDGFVYDGKWSNYRKKRFGSKSDKIHGEQFVITLQNHDQVGNASQGKRLSSIAGRDLYRLASMLLFFSPNIPLLFMGQEWAANTPFLFFTSYNDHDLAEKVKIGYQKEQGVEGVDPQSQDRFLASKLRWDELDRDMFEFYKKLIHFRKTHPALAHCNKELLTVTFDEEKKWLVAKRQDALLVVNLGKDAQDVPIDDNKWRLCLESKAGVPVTILQSASVPGHSAYIYTRTR